MMSAWPYFDEKRIDLVSTDSIQRRSFNEVFSNLYLY